MLDNFKDVPVLVYDNNFIVIGILPLFKIIRLHEDGLLIRGDVWFTEKTTEEKVKSTINDHNNNF